MRSEDPGVRQGARLLHVALLVPCAAILHAACGSEPPSPDTLRHVVVIGASASAGHGTGNEVGAQGEDVALADVLRVMIKSKEGRVTDASDALFLIAPESTGAELADKARESDPSCVIAVDFLYWLAHGRSGSLDDRLGRLDVGLKQLEGIECPVLISELPALQLAPGGGSSARSASDPEMLEALNRIIVAWADARTKVWIVPIKERLADLYEEKTVQVAGNRWKPPEAIAEILQMDGRHPTVAGLGMIAALCLETLVESNLVSESDVDLDARAAARTASSR